MAEVLKDGVKSFAIDGIRKYLGLEAKMTTPHYGYQSVHDAVIAAENLMEFPEIAEAIVQAKMAISKAYSIELGDVDVNLETYKKQKAETNRYIPSVNDSSVVSNVSNAIRRVRNDEERKMALEFVGFGGEEAEMSYIQKMGRQFVERTDLTKPFKDSPCIPYANWHRSFDLKIGETSYKCTLVVSNINGKKCSFILERANKPEKNSCVIELSPHGDMHREHDGNSEQAEMLMTFFKIARSSVREFREMSENIKNIHSGKKYGKMDVFGTAINLVLRSYGEEDVFNEADDPLAVYALSLDMGQIAFFNGGLNALEYAALSVSDENELQNIQKDEATFIYHAMRGLIILFKKVLTGGATGKYNILEGLDEELTGWIKVEGNDDDKGSINAPFSGNGFNYGDC